MSEFYVHPQMKDGTLNKCKVCTKRDVAARYSQTIHARHAYEKARNKTPARRRQLADSRRRTRVRSPEKEKAWRLVSHAVRDGRLQRRPCVVCGEEKAQAHHPDYSKPLDVQWLCFKHHRETHGQVVF